MATTKEEVLQKAQDFLKEKKWNLSNNFVSKHVEKRLPENLDDEDVTADSIVQSWADIFESCYHAQSTFAAENKPTPQPNPKTNPKPNEKTFELPDDVKEKLAWIDEQKNKVTIAEKRSQIFEQATKDMTEAQKKSFKTFFETQSITADTDVDAVSSNIVTSYTELTKALIGNDAPLSGSTTAKTLEEEFADVGEKKVTINK